MSATYCIIYTCAQITNPGSLSSHVTGMNIRMSQSTTNQDSGSSSQSDTSEGHPSTFQPIGSQGGSGSSDIPGYPGGPGLGSTPSMPQWAPQGIVPGGIPPPHQMLPPQGHPQEVERKSVGGFSFC